MIHEWSRNGYWVSTDAERLDIDCVHAFLCASYWAPDRSRERVLRSIEASIPFGVYLGEQQVGFGRVVTDTVVIAYLADVFVEPSHRGRGLGRWLIECMQAHPDLHRICRWLLGTRDAHEFYEQFGFVRPSGDKLMERLHPDADREPAAQQMLARGLDDGSAGSE